MRSSEKLLLFMLSQLSHFFKAYAAVTLIPNLFLQFTKYFYDVHVNVLQNYTNSSFLIETKLSFFVNLRILHQFSMTICIFYIFKPALER